MFLMFLLTFIYWQDIKQFSTHHHKHKCGLICLIYTTLCSLMVGFLSLFSLLQEAV